MKAQRRPSLADLMIVVLALTLAATVSLSAGPGDLDPDFGEGGIVTTDFFGSFDEAHAVAVDSAGRILVAGFAGGPYPHGADFAVARYNQDGTFDSSFGDGGIVLTDFGQSVQAHAMALDSAERIVVVGGNFHVARYNVDGSLDTTFAGDGTARIEFPQGVGGSAQAVALDATGRIVVVGTVATGYIGNPSVVGVARLNADGTPDVTMDGDGRVVTDFGSTIAFGYGVALDMAGRIVVAGRVYTGPDYNGTGFAVARYNDDGSLDVSFGRDGRVTNDFGGRGAIGRAVAIDPYGRVVVAGSTYAGAFETDVALARYREDGSPDDSFGAGGLLIADFGGSDAGYAIALDSSDRIIIAGRAGAAGRFAVLRYLADGSPDVTFGGDGKVETSFGWSGSDGYALVLDGTGRIVVAGRAGLAAGYTDWAVARYAIDGDVAPPRPPIDIKPGDPDNIVSLAARGKMMVAVLSTPAFDAPDAMDVMSVTFGRSGYERSVLHRRDGSPDCTAVDVSGDGRGDLACWFLVKVGDFQIGDKVGILRGATAAGMPIVAIGALQIVP